MAQYYETKKVAPAAKTALLFMRDAPPHKNAISDLAKPLTKVLAAIVLQYFEFSRAFLLSQNGANFLPKHSKKTAIMICMLSTFYETICLRRPRLTSAEAGLEASNQI